MTWLGLDFLGEIIVNNYEARFNNVRPLLATSAGFGAYTFWTYKKWVALNRDPHDLIVAMRSKLQRDMGTILSEEHIVKKQKEDIETLIKEYEEDTKK